MDWNRFFLDIQATPLSTWIRESPSLLGMPALLIVHAIGMGFLVGISYALSLRVFGFAPSIPLQSMKAIVPVMRVAFWLNATSGLLLVLGFLTGTLLAGQKRKRDDADDNPRTRKRMMRARKYFMTQTVG
jgi:hypothetical protein